MYILYNENHWYMHGEECTDRGGVFGRKKNIYCVFLIDNIIMIFLW